MDFLYAVNQGEKFREIMLKQAFYSMNSFKIDVIASSLSPNAGELNRKISELPIFPGLTCCMLQSFGIPDEIITVKPFTISASVRVFIRNTVSEILGDPDVIDGIEGDLLFYWTESMCLFDNTEASLIDTKNEIDGYV